MAKQELQERFNRLFKDCELYAIQLNGFSHTAYYKDSKGNKHIGVCSFYASSCECDSEETLYGDNVYRSYSTDRLKALFIGYPHYAYQNNAEEIVYKDVSEW